MSPLEDWRYEELRERMVAELPPRKRGAEEDPRIARLRVALRKGEGLASDAWAVELDALDTLLEEELLADRRERWVDLLT